MLQASDIECPRELRCGREIDPLHNGKRQQSKAETRGKAEPVARERRPRAGAAGRNGNDREQIGDDHRPTAGADRGGAGHKSVENSK